MNRADQVAVALSTIEASLARFDRHIALRALQPGISSVDVGTLVEAVGLAGTPQLTALYGWRKGTSMTGVRALDDVHVFPGFYLLSLQDGAKCFERGIFFVDGNGYLEMDDSMFAQVASELDPGVDWWRKQE